MDYPEGINQVKRLWRHESAELFRIPRAETNAVFQSEHGGALACQLHRFLRKVYRRDLRTCAGKIDRVRPDPAPDFQHFLAVPPRELRKSRYVIFHKVFSRLDLVEVFLRAHRRGRMPDIARTIVPIILYSR